MYLNTKLNKLGNLAREIGPGDVAVDQSIHLRGTGENKPRTFFILEMMYLYKGLPDSGFNEWLHLLCVTQVTPPICCSGSSHDSPLSHILQSTPSVN